VAACRLIVLGGFSLAAADGAKLVLPTRKDKLLLAFLALSAGRPQSRERLAALLWGDRAEAQARDSLKQSLADLRQAFRQAGLEPLRTDRESVTFEPTGIEVDALEFGRLATQTHAFDKAIALYRGDLIDGIDGGGTAFEEWLRPERERLSALAVRVLEQCVLGSAASEADDETIRFGYLLLARDRLREPVYRALMRLYARKGERTESLKVYAACRAALKQDLGVAPDAKTEALYRDILTDRLSPVAVISEVDPTTDRPSIAVLPFSNLSGDSQLAHLCDGITEDIITGLGRFRMLFVIDRHSSSTISEQTSDVAEIGRRLGVYHLVQGSLKRLGEQVRITVRLIDAASRAQLWGEAYDCALSDILAVPDKVTGAIVSTLHSHVESSLAERCRRSRRWRPMNACCAASNICVAMVPTTIGGPSNCSSRRLISIRTTRWPMPVGRSQGSCCTGIPAHPPTFSGTPCRWPRTPSNSTMTMGAVTGCSPRYTRMAPAISIARSTIIAALSPSIPTTPTPSHHWLRC